MVSTRSGRSKAATTPSKTAAATEASVGSPVQVSKLQVPGGNYIHPSSDDDFNTKEVVNQKFTAPTTTSGKLAYAMSWLYYRTTVNTGNGVFGPGETLIYNIMLLCILGCVAYGTWKQLTKLLP